MPSRFSKRENGEKGENGSKKGPRPRGFIMGFLRHLRSRSKLDDKDTPEPVPFPAAYTGPDQTSLLSEKILRRIFEFVCPHASDDTLQSSELSATDGCMLCDLRDLANCCQVRRSWYPVASSMLYFSIRIDPVHYCPREEIYHQKMRRKSRHEPIDPPVQRLQQLCRTVRENQYCANGVHFLKIPYMTRESRKADLARTISVLPNLEYVDLPEGFYTGDVACHTLRQELQARCPNIRKMKYSEGSELSLEFLIQGQWQGIRVLEIAKLRIEPGVLRRVLGMLSELSDLTFTGLPWLNDTIFHPVAGLPEFPPLEIFTLKLVPDVTPHGLVSYISTYTGHKALKTLHIKDCDGIPVSALHAVLAAAKNLTQLAYTATVSASMPLDPIPPLASTTLHTLNFEIESATPTHPTAYPPAASYHEYLTSSLMGNSLPALRKLYVTDADFVESLTLAPPIVPFADSQQRARGFNQPLEVFSKGMNELDWVGTSVAPADPFSRRGSMAGGRPMSSYSANKGLGAFFGGEARHSIVVGNGQGRFLAVPVDDGRPKSAGGWEPPPDDGVRASWLTHEGRAKRGSRADLWR